MSVGARLLIGGVLALVAVALLLFTLVSAERQITGLEDEAAYYQNQLVIAQTELSGFETAVTGPAFQDALDEIVAEPDAEDRRERSVRVLGELDGLSAPYPLGMQVNDLVLSIAEAPSAQERRALRDELDTLLFGEDVIVEPVFLPAPATAETLSTLIGAAGAIGSGLMSLLVFLRGSRTRDLEREMLALDVELKQIAVAEARHAARSVMAERGTTAAPRPPEGKLT